MLPFVFSDLTSQLPARNTAVTLQAFIEYRRILRRYLVSKREVKDIKQIKFPRMKMKGRVSGQHLKGLGDEIQRREEEEVTDSQQ